MTRFQPCQQIQSRWEARDRTHMFVTILIVVGLSVVAVEDVRSDAGSLVRENCTV